jgi:hypothetical protein
VGEMSRADATEGFLLTHWADVFAVLCQTKEEVQRDLAIMGGVLPTRPAIPEV